MILSNQVIFYQECGIGGFNLTLLCFLHTVDRLIVVEQPNNTLTLWIGTPIVSDIF